MPGIANVIEHLSRRYRLGLAANQTRACRAALDELGFLHHFEITGLSEEMGLSKPAPEFFEYLLAQASCKPAEAVMVGDRIDNDIAPAKRMGMRTVWVKLDLKAKGYEPQTPHAKAYFASQCRVGVSNIEPRSEPEQPDITVTTIDDICPAVAQIDCDSDSTWAIL